MKKQDFSYLKKYTYKNYGGKTVVVAENNLFFPLDQAEITEAELFLGFPFPPQLRAFYEEIGYGYLSTPHTPPVGHHQSGNEILHPLVVAHFARGEREWEGQDRWMSEAVAQGLKTGHLPFFEMYDRRSLRVPKAQSENPNALW